MNDIRTGLICRSDCSGLGFQTRELYKFLKPKKVLLIDSTPFNGREQHPEWYDKDITTISKGFLTNPTILRFIKDIDVLITCEVPYSDTLYRICKKNNVKTIL